MNKLYLLTLLSLIKIRKITSSLYIKDFELTMHDINKYVLILIYIFVIKNNVKILNRIYKNIYFVDNLKIYILLNNNVINLKKIILNVV